MSWAFVCWSLFCCNPKRDSAPPTTLAPRYAQNFRFTDCGVELWGFSYGQTDTLVFARPEKPWSRIATMSTTHLPMLDAIGELPRLKALANGSLVYDSAVLAAIALGSITDLGGQMLPQPEQIAALGVEAIFVFGMDASTLRTYDQLRTLGVEVVPIGEWMEADPLGRAEWLKVFGYLLGKEAQAQAVFDSIAARYERVKALPNPPKPTVISGTGYNGIWNAPGGRSYMARLIADAGGSYVWAADSSRGSLSMGLEGFYRAGLGAQIWLNPGTATSKADITASEPRTIYFDPMRKGRVYNCTRRISARGGYDFYESGVLRPDLILADLRVIFSGSADSLYYYRIVE